MQKNKIVLFISATTVGLIFGIVAFLVWLSRGKNPGLIKAKLKFGAMLIAITTACSTSNCQPFVSCYEPAPLPPVLNIDELESDQEIQINLSSDDSIDGEILWPQNRTLSYKIFPYNSLEEASLFQSGNIEPLDGLLDNYPERFTIPVDNLEPGTYAFHIYNRPIEETVANLSPYESYTLEIIP